MTYYIGKKELEEVSRVIRDNSLERYFTPHTSKVSQFERQFSSYCDTNYSLAVSSGTAALICCLKAIGISYGDEVILPAHTYVATALAVLSVGAIPVIVNINDSLNIDVEEIKNNISDSTKAIIPVHMYGLPCYMQEVLDLANKYKIFVIEDVAQACGGTYKGRKLGSLGDMGAFSFNHYKVISSGEGGAIVTNNKEFYLNSVVEHHGGIYFEKDNSDTFKNYHRIGNNYRLSEISGAVLLAQLKRIELFLKDLRKEKGVFLQEFGSSTYGNFIIPPVSDPNGDCSRVFFLRFENDELAEKFLTLSKQNNIDAFLSFSAGHAASCWQDLMQNANVLKKIDKDTFAKRKLKFCSKRFLPTDKILKCTVGINMKHNRDEAELGCVIQSTNKILRGL